MYEVGVSHELARAQPDEAGGSESSSYQDVLKTELASGTAPDVFWIPGTDIADFAEMNAVWDAWVSEGDTPCRACVVSPALADPRLTVEIMITAAK